MTDRMKFKIKVEGDDDGADNECYVQYWYNSECDCNLKHEMKVETESSAKLFDVGDKIAVQQEAKEANILDCQSLELAACSSNFVDETTPTEDVMGPSVETLSRRCHVVLDRTDYKTDVSPAPDFSPKNEIKREWEKEDDDVQFVDWRIKSEQVDIPDVEFPDETADSEVGTESTQKIEKPVNSRSKSFQCAACSISFQNKDSLTEHVSNHCFKGAFPLCVIEKQFKCEQCQKLCSSRYQFKTHKLSHAGVKPYKCEVCNRGFMDKSNMKKHAILHTGEKPYACNICPQRYADKSCFNCHMRWHSGVKPHGCKMCGRKFFTMRELKSHAQTHNGENSILCKICGQSFTELGMLRLHLPLHANEKPFECKVCRMRFEAKTYLQNHLKTHSIEETAACEVCQKIYLKRNLSTHLQIHTRLNLYGCQVCDTKFVTKGRLEKHMWRHSTVRPYACGMCTLRYTEKHQLEGHINKHLGVKPYECTLCDKKYETKRRLREHVDVKHVVAKLMKSLL